jgi:hypothetical protein
VLALSADRAVEARTNRKAPKAIVARPREVQLVIQDLRASK